MDAKHSAASWVTEHSAASLVTERSADALVQLRDVAMHHGTQLVQHGLSFDIHPGEVFVIIGASGSGKSTLLRHLIGLQPPFSGQVCYGEHDLYDCPEGVEAALRRRFGVMFQAGALWSSMTVGENLMLPMRLYSRLNAHERQRQARYKLALVGLDGAFDLQPAQLSGGMRKRAAIARALALDPELLYLDEPSSGLDPLNSARLDELILNLRHDLGTTVVMVTHEIDSVFAVADRVLFLDEQEKTMTALGTPQELRDAGPAAVRDFMSRGRSGADGSDGTEAHA